MVISSGEATPDNRLLWPLSWQAPGSQNKQLTYQRGCTTRSTLNIPHARGTERQGNVERSAQALPIFTATVYVPGIDLYGGKKSHQGAVRHCRALDRCTASAFANPPLFQPRWQGGKAIACRQVEAPASKRELSPKWIRQQRGRSKGRFTHRTTFISAV